MKAMQSEIKENIQGTNSEGKETGTQINNLGQNGKNNLPLPLQSFTKWPELVTSLGHAATLDIPDGRKSKFHWIWRR